MSETQDRVARLSDLSSISGKFVKASDANTITVSSTEINSQTSRVYFPEGCKIINCKGFVKVTCSVKTGSSGHTSYLEVFVNGNCIGYIKTTSTSYTNLSMDVYVTDGDYITCSVRNSYSGSTKYGYADKFTVGYEFVDNLNIEPRVAVCSAAQV